MLYRSLQVSKYLADNTLNAISEMFSSAREIMNWLADCARLVASDGDGGSPVCWTSPLGLPIMQPYHKPQMVTLHTATQSFTVSPVESTAGASWLLEGGRQGCGRANRYLPHTSVLFSGLAAMSFSSATGLCVCVCGYEGSAGFVHCVLC